MQPDEFDDFLRRLARQGYSLALSEPGFHFPLDRPLLRTQQSYYLPWEECLARASFEIREATAGIKNTASRLRVVKTNGESWRQILARPRNAAADSSQNPD